MDHIQEVNTTILSMNLPKHLPIGTSDAGSLLSTSLATGIDFFMANVHPWFATVGASAAAAWTDQFFQSFDVVSGTFFMLLAAMLICRMLLLRPQTTQSVILPRQDGLQALQIPQKAIMVPRVLGEMPVWRIFRVGY